MNVLVERECLEDIADAIREMLDTNEEYLPSEMADAIYQIKGEGNLESLYVSENGVYYPEEEDEIEGYSEVEVEVPNNWIYDDDQGILYLLGEV